jgi:hypothetical protein
MDLKTFTSVSRWRLPVFNGRLHIEGRILSVSEAQTNGLASGLLIASIAPPELLNKSLDSEDPNDLMELSRHITPIQIAKLNESNDKIICQVIKRGSMDGGENWEDIIIVNAEEQQDPDNNKMWVGVFSEEDRSAILDKALQGHKEAADRIASFRK